MRNDNAGQAEGIVQLAYQLDQHPHGNRILPGKRLVIKHQRRIERNGAGHGHASRHAAGQFIRHQETGAAQPHRLQLHQHQVAHQGFGQIGVLTDRKGHVIEDIQVSEQRAALKHHAHALAQVVKRIDTEIGHVYPIDDDRSGGGAQLSADQLEQGGLAGAAGSHNRRNETPADVQIYAVEDDALTASITQVADTDDDVIRGLACFLTRFFHIIRSCLPGPVTADRVPREPVRRPFSPRTRGCMIKRSDPRIPSMKIVLPVALHSRGTHTTGASLPAVDTRRSTGRCACKPPPSGPLQRHVA